MLGMANIDPVLERQRLTALYAGMGDGELSKLLSEWEELSDIAREALRDEADKRQIPIPLVEKAADTGEYVLLRTLMTLPEAMAAMNALEASGLDCKLADDNMVRIDWFISNLLGGVKLFVRERDLEAAEEILGHDATDPQVAEDDGAENTATGDAGQH